MPESANTSAVSASSSGERPFSSRGPALQTTSRLMVEKPPSPARNVICGRRGSRLEWDLPLPKRASLAPELAANPSRENFSASSTSLRGAEETIIRMRKAPFEFHNIPYSNARRRLLFRGGRGRKRGMNSHLRGVKKVCGDHHPFDKRW